MSLVLGGKTILDDVDLEVDAGDSVAVVGRSGSGKSSLLSCVLGLIPPSAGTIVVDDVAITGLRRSGLSRMRREKLGMIFQTGELLVELSPRENVMISGLLAGQRPREAAAKADHLLEALGVPDGARSIAEFSGGERQRVAVARALMNDPRLLLADEPTGSLDPPTRDQVVDIIFDVPRRFGCALVVVTHDPEVARRATRLTQLSGGVLRELPMSDAVVAG
ncbi:ABC transporter ATP-binding protein [Blastococcus sp. TF02-8]|uniref:ABC transporter ATP-binding protein n=1 Tax=Blastococcus sp. TF02-8 TaxID=2250574 RepID=UPI00197AEA71|nr:ATP-binding cassette domain-containing protein [Blastococcus sp. TF02-8]